MKGSDSCDCDVSGATRSTCLVNRGSPWSEAVAHVYHTLSLAPRAPRGDVRACPRPHRCAEAAALSRDALHAIQRWSNAIAVETYEIFSYIIYQWLYGVIYVYFFVKQVLILSEHSNSVFLLVPYLSRSLAIRSPLYIFVNIFVILILRFLLTKSEQFALRVCPVWVCNLCR